MLTQVLLRLLRRQSRQPPQVDGEGRVVVGLTPALAGFGICAAALAAYMLFLPAVLLIETEAFGTKHVVITVMGWLFGGAMAFAAYRIFGMGLKFSDAGLLHRRLLRTRLIGWSDVREIAVSPITGTYLRTSFGKVPLFKYRRGIVQLIDELRARKVTGAENRKLEELT